MSMLVIDEFRIGLDHRKSEMTSPATSLRIAQNCFINAGAEIEKRKAFVKVATVPGTIGLHGAGDEFVVFEPSGAEGFKRTITPELSAYGFSSPGLVPERLFSAQFWQDGYFFSAGAMDNSWKQSYYAGQPLGIEAAGFDNRVFESKMYTVDGSILRFSDIADPSSWDSTAVPNLGAGFIDVSQVDAFGTKIYGLERYYQQLAIFGLSTIQIWSVDADPKLNSIVQTIGNTGLYSRRGHTPFINGDIIYLSQTGIRSLRARDASNFAETNDIGSPIDTYVRKIMRSMALDEIDRYVCMAVEPKNGALYVAFKNRILVLSFFPTAKVNAWSEFTVPFDIDYMCANDRGLALRSGDDVYLYGGGYNDNIYDDCEAIIRTPFIDAKSPASKKLFVGIDAAVEGEWDIRYNVNPAVPNAWSPTARITEATYPKDILAMSAFGSHIQFELRSKSASRATINSLVCHFEGKELK